MSIERAVGGVANSHAAQRLASMPSASANIHFTLAALLQAACKQDAARRQPCVDAAAAFLF